MNLPDLIKTGESENIEFKEKFDEQTIESAVAFANTKGSIIFIGDRTNKGQRKDRHRSKDKRKSNKTRIYEGAVPEKSGQQQSCYMGPPWGHNRVKGARR